MRLVATCLTVMVLIGLAACGETSGIVEQSEREESGTQPVADSVPAEPTATPTMRPLAKSEEEDESDYLTNAVTFAEILRHPVPGPGRSGTSLTNTLAKGAFQVSIVRAGPFTISDSTAGENRYFRVDLRIQNMSEQAEAFGADSFVLTGSDGKSYELETGATDRAIAFPIDMGPDATQRGFVLFQPVPEDTPTVMLTFMVPSEQGGDPYEFEFEVNLSEDAE